MLAKFPNKKLDSHYEKGQSESPIVPLNVKMEKKRTILAVNKCKPFDDCSEYATIMRRQTPHLLLTVNKLFTLVILAF